MLTLTHKPKPYWPGLYLQCFLSTLRKTKQKHRRKQTKEHFVLCFAICFLRASLLKNDESVDTALCFLNFMQHLIVRSSLQVI